MDQVKKFSKAEVDYKKSSSPAEHRCGICEFMLDDGGCALVEGKVEDLYGCKLFSADLIKWANDPITLAAHPPKE